MWLKFHCNCTTTHGMITMSWHEVPQLLFFALSLCPGNICPWKCKKQYAISFLHKIWYSQLTHCTVFHCISRIIQKCYFMKMTSCENLAILKYILSSEALTVFCHVRADLWWYFLCSHIFTYKMHFCDKHFHNLSLP